MNPTIKQLQAELTAVTAERNTYKAAVEAYRVPMPGKRTADEGAEELAVFLYDRIPGLVVSETFGGPVVEAPVKTRYAEGSSMVMSVRTPDGKLYQVETYLQGT